jgi:hypothetical protein
MTTWYFEFMYIIDLCLIEINIDLLLYCSLNLKHLLKQMECFFHTMSRPNGFAKSFASRYLLIIVLIACSLTSHAQTDILAPLGITQIYPYQFKEQLNAHYFLTYKYNAGINVYGQNPIVFTLYKTDKNAHIVLLSKTVFGDSYQADSVIGFTMRFLVKDDKIHLFYTKSYLVDSTLLPVYKRFSYALCYQQLDTNFTTLIPEKKIVTTTGNDRLMLGNVSCAIDLNGNVAVCCMYNDTSSMSGLPYLSKYHILNSSGQVIKQDSAGIVTGAATNVVEMVHYGASQVIVSGQVLFPNSSSPAMGCFYTADMMLNLVDTFVVKGASVYKAPDVDGAFARWPNIVSLSGGNLVFGAQYSHTGPSSNIPATHSVLTKQRQATRFLPDSLVVIPGYNSGDVLDNPGHGLHNLTYNANDNLLYYATNTNMISGFPTHCAGPDDYVQVACADTNMKIKWRKFIYSGTNTCALITYMQQADKRSGCLVAVERTPTNQPFNPLLVTDHVYYFDSTGTLGIKETQNETVRDRIKLYPNPASDYLVVDDIFSKIETVQLLDMNGRVVKESSATNAGSKTRKLDISSLPSAVYIARVVTADQEVYNIKFFKSISTQ